MSFAEPIRLWFFVGLALLAASYVAVQFRSRTYALEFSDASLLDSIAEKVPGWRRHVTAVAFLGVLAALIVAFARPTAEVEVPRERAIVLLTIDTSLSMGADDVEPTRIGAAQQAAREFLDNAPDGIDIGLVSFDETPIVHVSPTDNRREVEAAINQLELGPFTNTGGAIATSLQTLDSALADLNVDPDAAPPAVIVLLSDGEPTIDDRPPIAVAIAEAVEARVAARGARGAHL